MTDKEITLLVRTLELDINKILQEFYHQRPREIAVSTWARHTIHRIGGKTLNTAMFINELIDERVNP